MSYIYGGLTFDNTTKAPYIEQLLSGIASRISDIPRDRSKQWLQDNIGFGNLLRFNTPESYYEHLPYSGDGLCITADARIDNRQDLLSLFTKLSETSPDSAFILEAYKHWGKQCADYLRGDFSFALWDEHKQQLVLCRDIMGVKPLYYYRDSRSFAFSSSIPGLLNRPDADYSLDYTWFANYFIDKPMQSDGTLYKNIKRVPPASCVVITADELQISPYFNFDERKEIHLSSAAEYAEQLYIKFTEAVKRRARSDYALGAELSGGLDSSSITIAASTNKSSSGSDLHTFSNVMTDTQIESGEQDERDYIHCVNQAAGTRAHFVSLSSGLLEMFKLAVKRYGQPATIGRVGVYFQPVFISAQQAGVRTLLSGYGGDQVVTAQAKSLIHGLLAKGNIMRYLAFVGGDFKTRPVHTVLKGLNMLKQSLSIIMFNKLSAKRMAAASVAGKLRILKYLKPAYVQKYDLTRVAINARVDMYCGLSLRRKQIKLLEKIPIAYRIDTAAVQCLYYGIDYVYPMLDRDLLEFMLAVPDKYKASPELGRVLFRQAMQHDLPAKITWRDDKFAAIVPSAKQVIQADLPELQGFLADDNCNHLTQHFFNMPLLQSSDQHENFLVNAVFSAVMLKIWTKLFYKAGINKFE